MKKIFIITGEPSGDKLASTVILKLKKQNPDIEYLSVGGAHIKKLGIQSIFDLKGIYYMPGVIKASKLGDAAIIKSIIKILDKEGVKVISSIFFNPELAVNVGTYTKLKPSTEDVKSIKKGIKYFTGLNELDHVQAIIVKDSKILAVEGRQGTKVMLSKIKKKTGGILIKLPKKKQDLRMDLPTIGLKTLKDCKKYGLKGIVLKSKKNIFLDKTKCISFANKNKIFIKAI